MPSRCLMTALAGHTPALHIQTCSSALDLSQETVPEGSSSLVNEKEAEMVLQVGQAMKRLRGQQAQVLATRPPAACLPAWAVAWPWLHHKRRPYLLLLLLLTNCLLARSPADVQRAAAPPLLPGGGQALGGRHLALQGAGGRPRPAAHNTQGGPLTACLCSRLCGPSWCCPVA